MALRAIVSPVRDLAEDPEDPIAFARAGLHAQAASLGQMANRLNGDFTKALKLILECKGRVVLCGMGKSGLIGRKLVATFSSTGTPAVFLHPGDAMHGDLGVVTRKDVLVLISNSGQTDEVVWLLPHFRDLGIPIIALVGQPQSAVGRAATVVLDVSVECETCPYNLTPTTSALSTMAMGDALAMAAMRARKFTEKDFARLHPGGALGLRLARRVRDVMKYLDLPLADEDMSVDRALLVMSAGRCGLVIITDEECRPLGIVTDGDLRRALQRSGGLLGTRLSEIMTRQPVTIPETASYKEAQERMHRLRLKALVAVDETNRVTGVVEIFDDV